MIPASESVTTPVLQMTAPKSRLLGNNKRFLRLQSLGYGLNHSIDLALIGKAETDKFLSQEVTLGRVYPMNIFTCSFPVPHIHRYLHTLFLGSPWHPEVLSGVNSKRPQPLGASSLSRGTGAEAGQS